MTRTITAFFDSRTEAQAAADKLRHMGLTGSDVTIHDTASTEARATAADRDEDKGFFAALSDFFLPDEDRYAYEEGMRRGGSVVTVRADESDFDRVSDVLEESGAVDLDTRESEWRSEGWSGTSSADYAATDRTLASDDRTGAGYRTATGTDTLSTMGGTAGMAAAGTGASTASYAGGTAATGTGMGGTGTTGRSSYETESSTTASGTGMGLGGTDATTRAAYGTERDTTLGTGTARASDLGTDIADRDGKIEVVEENLRVGKRDVGHGRVRVRSYVREEPVSEDVSLRSERVEIERRAVDRPVAAGDAAFRDQSFELEERAEEAVVSKEARVKEEIDLRKVASERTETVSDTVRRTEVDIEDERRGRSLTEDEVRLQGERKL